MRRPWVASRILQRAHPTAANGECETLSGTVTAGRAPTSKRPRPGHNAVTVDGHIRATTLLEPKQFLLRRVRLPRYNRFFHAVRHVMELRTTSRRHQHISDYCWRCAAGQGLPGGNPRTSSGVMDGCAATPATPGAVTPIEPRQKRRCAINNGAENQGDTRKQVCRRGDGGGGRWCQKRAEHTGLIRGGPGGRGQPTAHAVAHFGRLVQCSLQRLLHLPRSTGESDGRRHTCGDHSRRTTGASQDTHLAQVNALAIADKAHDGIDGMRRGRPKLQCNCDDF